MANEYIRVLFLEKFFEEIIKNISKEYEAKLKIEAEKIKKKILPKTDETEDHSEEFKKMVFEKILPPHKYQKVTKIERIKPVNSSYGLVKKNFVNDRFPVLPRIPTMIKESFEKLNLESFSSSFEQKPYELSLGKLDSLLKDKLIQAIECPGPGKNVLVKKFNKISITNIVLTQEEINSIITEFSNKARIPLVGGILKAAVEDLLIYAVVSNFAGSKFVINRTNV